MASSEKRFELLKLVHNHALTAEAVTERVAKYEKFLESDVPPAADAPKKASGGRKKGGDLPI